MLQYAETVLEKVSFNRELFRNELEKSIKWLQNDEVRALKSWCILHFGALYMDVINDVFS
jgi:hypothetical protein